MMWLTSRGLSVLPMRPLLRSASSKLWKCVETCMRRSMWDDGPLGAEVLALMVVVVVVVLG